MLGTILSINMIANPLEDKFEIELVNEKGVQSLIRISCNVDSQQPLFKAGILVILPTNSPTFRNFIASALLSVEEYRSPAESSDALNISVRIETDRGTIILAFVSKSVISN